MKINVFDINKDISFSTSTSIEPIQPSQLVNNSNFTNTIKIRPPLT